MSTHLWRALPEPKDGNVMRLVLTRDAYGKLAMDAAKGTMSIAAYCRVALELLSRGKVVGPEEVYAEARKIADKHAKGK